MIVLENQKAYKCECCNRRYFKKSSCLEHQKNCKKHPDSPRNPLNCPHDDEMMATSYSPIYGEEHRSEPDYDYCTNCGKRDFD
ncbi:MAG: hypothetical protein JWM44_2664 [Bacilli bacterium]|nr:hypothetical protein [Bacilli bacterium]